MTDFAEQGRKAFEGWMLEKGEDRALAKLQLRYLSAAGEFAEGRGWLTGPILEETDPFALHFLRDLCLGDEEFLSLDAKKNGNLRLALERYALFREAIPANAAARGAGAARAASPKPSGGEVSSVAARGTGAASPKPTGGGVSSIYNRGENAPEGKREVSSELADGPEIRKDLPGNGKAEEILGKALKVFDAAALEKAGAADSNSGRDVFGAAEPDFGGKVFGAAASGTGEARPGMTERASGTGEAASAAAAEAPGSIPASESESAAAAPRREPSTMEILFGRTEPGGEAFVWRPNDTNQVFHTNMGIIGTMGTGKTQFTKSVVTQLWRQGEKNFLGRELGILIFDYKGDYNESKPEFVEATRARVLKTFHLPFNPLALTKTPVFRPLLPTHTANAFVDSICKAYGLGPRQQNTLFKYILMAYRQSGILPERPETWNRVPPTLAHVIALMRRDGELDKNDKLASAMARLDNFQIFEPVPTRTKGLFEILKGVVVIDLSGCDANLQSFIVSITLDLFYMQMQAAGSSRLDGRLRELTRFILVDEADNFMSEDFPSLKRILKEGREFGVGTILTTQFLKNFNTEENDYDKYILTWVVHNVADLRLQDVDFVFGTKARSRESAALAESIRQLKKHHSLVRVGGGEPCMLEDLAFWQLEKA